VNQQARGFGVYQSGHDGAQSPLVELLAARRRVTAPTVLPVPVTQQSRSLGVGPQLNRHRGAGATAGQTDVLRPSGRLHPGMPGGITDITTD
jgi:hypothetical protein